MEGRAGWSGRGGQGGHRSLAGQGQGQAPHTHLGQVQVDFVSIEIGVEGGAVGVVEADSALRCKCNST